MNKQTNNLDEKELLKTVEDLIDGKTSNQKFINSFLGFCSRLFSVRPKTDEPFQLSLKRELLKKHPAYFKKEVDSRKKNKIQNLVVNIKEVISMKKTKLALIGVPATLVIALTIIFTSVISPVSQTARAMEIIANDPQIREVIERYNLDVQKVITKGNTAYIILNTVDNVTHIMKMDLKNGTVEEIVKEQSEKNIAKYEAFEQKAAAMGMTVEEFKSYLQEQYETKAESMGMSTEEFKKYLKNQKKTEAEAFEQKAAAMGMTVEEFKSYLQEQYETKAESMGMSTEEFKKYLENQKKEYYENFKAEAEAKGMTEEEYKEYLGNQKK
ncbi:MAG: hypothetical protein JRI86_05160 [Deltaproteobacteria bacterium]|nr:hypothetical protein [Deltaproteobacteria bacterium]